MSSEFDLEPEEVIAAQEERTFREAGTFEWRGEPLRPFSFLRLTAALAMGLQYGSLSPEDVRRIPNPLFRKRREAEEEIARLESRLKSKKMKSRPEAEREVAERAAAELKELVAGLESEPEFLETYDALIEDAALVIWLCLQKDSVCARARRMRDDYKAEVAKWADSQGITLNSEGCVEACNLFGEIMENLNRSKVKPEIRDGGGGEEKN